MKIKFTKFAMICSVLVGILALSGPALAQQKTVKACQDEWRANKAANQAIGLTERAYVDKCRVGAAAQPPAATTGAPPAAAKTAVAPAAKTAVAPSSAPTSQKAARPAATAALASTGANEFSAEAQARTHCPTDTVIWANLKSRIYHFSGSKDYGTTKEGAYMCEKDAVAQGVRAAKNEKHP
jgi:hypothetical protein